MTIQAPWRGAAAEEGDAAPDGVPGGAELPVAGEIPLAGGAPGAGEPDEAGGEAGGGAEPAATAGTGLTGEQEEAIGRRRGAMLLAANAGSGKTRVLVERFVRAVHEDGVAPSRILAITFTERAAGELRERVRRRLYELGDRRAARDTEASFVSTIHGFCAGLLRAHPLAAGLAPGFAVLDEGTSAALRHQAFERALAAWLTDGAALDLAAACGVDRLEAAILGVHDELRSRGRRRPELPGARPRREVGPARAELSGAGRALARELDGTGRVGIQVRAALGQLARDPELVAACELRLARGARALRTPLAEAYEEARLRCCEAEDDAAGVVGLALLRLLLAGFAAEFARLKAGRGALDFDDLELCARDLLAGDAGLRRRWSERFELLMVDELQDTNPREMAILAALDRGNLFTVGDEFQSIYGFRHADVGIFRGRRRELEGADGVRVLSRNFRTRPPILAAINATFAPIFGADFVPLVAGRADGREEEPLVELMVSDTAGWEDTAAGETPGAGPAWRRVEAAVLAERIGELIGSGAARPGEVVVLLRYATAARVYERALAERGVAVVGAPGGGFYATQEVADLGAYVQVLANPLDDLALYGVLASPVCGLEADGLAVVAEAARALERAPWEVIEAAGEGSPAAVAGLAPLSGEERALLWACHAHIAGERRAAPGLGLSELLLRSGYRERALGGPGSAVGLANLHKLLRLAREFEAREGRDLRRFADRLAAGSLGSSRGRDAELAPTEAVRLMTVHAAKGLEFPVVCVADLGHGPPNGGPLILTDGERVGLRLPTLEGKRIEAFAYGELRRRREAAAVAEEQRIAYVAMTRARERLILSGAAHFAHWPAGGAAAAIAWLAPAMVADLPARLAGPPGVSELGLGGARVRLTLTAAGEPPPVVVPREPVLEPGEPVPGPGEPVLEPREPVAELGEPVAEPRESDLEPREPAVGRPPPVAGRPPLGDDRSGPAAAGAPGADRGPGAAGRPGADGRPAIDDSPQTALFGRGPGGWAPFQTPDAGREWAAGAAGAAAAAAEPMAAAAEPAGPAAVAPATPPPSAVSYSSLADHARCGYRYYLRRVLGLDEVAPPPGLEPPGSPVAGLDPAVRGDIVHRLLEELDFGAPGRPAARLVRAQAGAGELEDAEVEVIAGLVGAFGRSTLCARLARAGAITREASFALTVDGLLVTGYLDVLAEEGGGGMLVVDYKSDRVDPADDLATRVAGAYGVQRRIYALAALRTGAASVEVAYCFLRRPEEVVAERYLAAEAGRLERELAILAGPLLAGRFPVAAEPHRGLCATCPGRGGLCSWEESVTLREQAAVHRE
ncbi:MAG: ATP-dependent helicase/nuclease subunit [Solirubrobacteraceae bacterium]|nr:ATP-dependent helicase/nuclease subunit [Solirubrobacteraceae bacterium]